MFDPPTRDQYNAGAPIDPIGNFFTGGNASRMIPNKPGNADFMNDYLRRRLAGGGNVAPAFQSADAAAARAQQAQLAALLQRQATGQQAGAGELAVNRQVGQATAAQQAQAMMARGQNAALAARGAARNTADIGTTGAGQAAQAQMQDQTNAQGQLAGLLGNMRGQDIGIGQGNQGAQVQTNGQNNSQELGYLSQLLGIDQLTLQQMLAKQQVANGDKGILPGLLQAGGTIGAAAAGNPGHAGI